MLSNCTSYFVSVCGRREVWTGTHVVVVVLTAAYVSGTICGVIFLQRLIELRDFENSKKVISKVAFSPGFSVDVKLDIKTLTDGDTLTLLL